MENLIADSAFSLADSIVPSCENPKGHEANDEETLFNDEFKSLNWDQSTAHVCWNDVSISWNQLGSYWLKARKAREKIDSGC